MIRTVLLAKRPELTASSLIRAALRPKVVEIDTDASCVNSTIYREACTCRASNTAGERGGAILATLRFLRAARARQPVWLSRNLIVFSMRSRFKYLSPICG